MLTELSCKAEIAQFNDASFGDENIKFGEWNVTPLNERQNWVIHDDEVITSLQCHCSKEPIGAAFCGFAQSIDYALIRKSTECA